VHFGDKKTTNNSSFFFYLLFFANFCHMVTKTKGLQLIERVFLGGKKKKGPPKAAIF
jgi:hypothetical protein